MLDGKWNLHIQFFAKTGAVPVAIENGKITGDDGSHSYDGTAKVDEGGRLAAELRIKRHIPGEGPSFNNLDEYTLSISGTVTESAFTGEGGVKGTQGRPFKFTGTKAN